MHVLNEATMVAMTTIYQYGVLDLRPDSGARASVRALRFRQGIVNIRIVPKDSYALRISYRGRTR